jgi:hypothetical protein
MPAFVTCPACGCKVQVAESVFGTRVRCFGCARPFTAAPDEGQVDPAAPLRPRPVAEQEGLEGPRCPRCDRGTTWHAPACPHCGLEFEPEDREFRRHFGQGHEARDREVRRLARGWAQGFNRLDAEPHRGALIASLGNVSLITGGLALCLFGTTAVVSVPLGIAAWVMASHDLDLMRRGLMDARGRQQTANGRTAAVLGVVLGLTFGAFFALAYLRF